LAIAAIVATLTIGAGPAAAAAPRRAEGALQAQTTTAPEGGLSVAVGFDGAVRPGATAPIDVRTPPMPAGGPAQLILETSALTPQTGRAVVSTVVPFQAVAGAVERLRVPVVIQDVRRPLRVRIMLGGRAIAAADVPFDPARVAGRLVVLVSDTRAGLGVLRDIDERIVDAYVPADGLPARWQEYGGVDLVVLRDVDPARFSDAQRDALLTWTRFGGRLVVIARPGARTLPAFLMPVLPAYLGAAGVLNASGDLAAKYGALPPDGPVPAVALVPRPGAHVVRAGGMPVIAGDAAGDGYVTVWGIDPTTAPLADWPGRQRLWKEALGTAAPPLVEPAVLADRLSPRIPVDRFTHVFAGLLIALYVGGLAMLRRRRPTLAGAAAGIAAAGLAVAVFANLAGSARARSTALTQVAVLRQARDASVAQALVVAAASVPYGGPVSVLAPSETVAAPVAMIGDLRIQWRDEAAMLDGRVRPDLPWVFQALGAVPLRTSARFDDATAVLTADLSAAGLRGAAVWWRGFVYTLGDLPAGRTSRRVGPSGWRRVSDVVADDTAMARFFRAPESQAPGPIAQSKRPLLAGEWPGRVPAFAVTGRMPSGAAGRRSAGQSPAPGDIQDVILIVPIDGPPPQTPSGQP
jgi:hypothetical protein